MEQVLSAPDWLRPARTSRRAPIRLATKLIALVVITVAIMLVVDGYAELRRERTLAQREMSERALLMGRALRGPIADVWREQGMERALELIDDVNAEEDSVAVRWVWLDGEASRERAPRLDRQRLQGDLGGGVSMVSEGESTPTRMFTYVRVDVPAEREGALELSESLDWQDLRTTNRIKRLSILLGGLLAVSAVTIFLLGVRVVGRPLAQLAAKAERVGEGDLSGPLELHRADELGDLALGLNRMCEHLAEAQEGLREETQRKIEALEHLRHENRLRTVGRLASGIAHELGTPLNVVSGRADLIQRGSMSESEVVESACIIRAQAERMTGIIRQLLDFARRRGSEKKVLDVDRLVASTCRFMETTARKQGVSLQAESDEDLPRRALGNESELQQVLTNLLMNAIQAMPDGGAVRISVSAVRGRPPGEEAPEASYVRVAVEDEGAGIAAENLPHVFEPFFTTKDVGSGTGLGLSIVHGILEDHRGWIQVESETGSGSRFTFHLPEESA